MSESRIMRRTDAGWEGVESRPYKDVDGSHRGVARHLLAVARGRRAGPGQQGEGLGAGPEGSHGPGGGAHPADPAPVPFEVRAFRVEPGGFTSRERHAHPHSVVVLEGRGAVRLGRGEEAPWSELGPLDGVWVAPWEVHQFRAAADQALTFLCVVPADRDGPEPMGTGAEADGPGAEPADLRGAEPGAPATPGEGGTR